jgi:hypothetical protein
MSRRLPAAMLAALSILWCAASASAETMRCQSVNGNLNCAGSSGVSCQSVDGKTVCTSGHGDVVQSFGNTAPSDPDDGTSADPSGDPSREPRHRGGQSRSLQLQQQGGRLHFQNDWITIDRD